MGIILDPSKGGNPTDPRFYSYDPDAYIANTFKVYDRMSSRPEPIPRAKNPMSQFVTPSDTLQRENELVAIIIQRKVDIAPNYETYRNIGFALAYAFGEGGREIFHQVCQPSPKYKHADADRQYTACLRARGRGITIGTFFHYAKQAGLH